MKVKYSRFRHNAKQTSFTSPTEPRRQGSEQEHAQYPTNDDVTSGWRCRRPENVCILSSLLRHSATRLISSCDRYYKVGWIYYKLRQVLQSAMIITNCESTDGPLFSLDNTQRGWRTTSTSNHHTRKRSLVLFPLSRCMENGNRANSLEALSGRY